MLQIEFKEFKQECALDCPLDADKYVSVKPSPSMQGLGKCFSVEAWIHPRSFPPYAPIVCKTDGGSFKVGFGLMKYGSTGKGDQEEVPNCNFWVQNYALNKVTTQPGAMEANQWYHVCGTYDGDNMKIYLNGTLHDKLRL